jgi:hypothetical protein
LLEWGEPRFYCISFSKSLILVFQSKALECPEYQGPLSTMKIGLFSHLLSTSLRNKYALNPLLPADTQTLQSPSYPHLWQPTRISACPSFIFVSSIATALLLFFSLENNFSNLMYLHAFLIPQKYLLLGC